MLLNRFKKISILIFSVYILAGWTTIPQFHSEEDFCQIYGSVFFVDNAADAEYTVYVEDEESFANISVYLEESPSYADIPGHWYSTPDPYLADVRIYISDNIAEADFTIAFTETESFAGCNDQ